MEQSSSEQFREHFNPLSAVQTVELGVVVKGQLPKELSTQLSIGYNAKIESRDDKDALLVTVRFDAAASKDGAEVLSGRCQVLAMADGSGLVSTPNRTHTHSEASTSIEAR